jgi:hypothetical protein
MSQKGLSEYKIQYNRQTGTQNHEDIKNQDSSASLRFFFFGDVHRWPMQAMAERLTN